MTFDKGSKACLFIGRFFVCFIILCLLNFLLSVWPYYLQFAVHTATSTKFEIDNFNLYVIGYTLFVIVITYFVPIIKKRNTSFYHLFEVLLIGVFFLSSAFLGFEYHDYITNGDNYSDQLRSSSSMMAKVFIGLNGCLIVFMIIVQAATYSLSRIRKI